MWPFQYSHGDVPSTAVEEAKFVHVFLEPVPQLDQILDVAPPTLGVVVPGYVRNGLLVGEALWWFWYS